MRTGKNTASMKIPKPYPVARTCLAVLALMANMVLPAMWSHAGSVSTVFEGSFSLCLANGGQGVDKGADQAPDAPSAATHHCDVCLFTGGLEAPSSGTDRATILENQAVVLSYLYTEPTLAAQRHALTSDARAPPA